MDIQTEADTEAEIELATERQRGIHRIRYRETERYVIE